MLLIHEITLRRNIKRVIWKKQEEVGRNGSLEERVEAQDWSNKTGQLSQEGILKFSRRKMSIQSTDQRSIVVFLDHHREEIRDHEISSDPGPQNTS